MVAGNVGNPRTPFCHVKQPLQNAVAVFVPIPRLLQLPSIDQVADQVQVFTRMLTQKLKQSIRSYILHAQMGIRYPDGPIVIHGSVDSPSLSRSGCRELLVV